MVNFIYTLYCFSHFFQGIMRWLGTSHNQLNGIDHQGTLNQVAQLLTRTKSKGFTNATPLEQCQDHVFTIDLHPHIVRNTLFSNNCRCQYLKGPNASYMIPNFHLFTEWHENAVLPKMILFKTYLQSNHRLN